MVAVVSGSGLGLFNSSTSLLGGGGADGNSQVGRGRDRIYVNSSTGNLIVQGADDILSAIGLDFAAVRTYNSQGLTDEDNGDNWRLGVHQRVYNLTGTVNTAGSTITKVFGDGAEVVYTWNATRSRYESTDGDGANDFLIWNSGNSRWTWTDGSARATEEYGLVNGVHRILFSRDTDQNTVTYNYTGSLLTSINMANPGGGANNAQTVTFAYTGNNLMSVQVSSWNGTALATQTLTSYTYDGLNRLETVTVDLTPTNTSDNATYVTTYTYEGSSRRIGSISQSDGSSVSFTYQHINGEYRLRTVTDAENRVTTFSYSEPSGGSGGTSATATANTAVLSNQETNNHARNDAALTTNATQTTPHSRNDSALSTTDTQTTPYNLDTGALTTPAGGSAWGAAATLEAEPSGSTAWHPQVAFDSSGNGFAIWSVTTSSTVVLKAARYTASTNTWSAPTTLYSASGSSPGVSSLAVDANGNALVAWIIGGQLRARRYTGSWGSTATVASVTGASQPVVSINGNHAAIAWVSGSALMRNGFVSRWTGSAWSSGTSIESQTLGVNAPSVAVDNQGNITVAWQQVANGNSDPCVWTKTYTASTNSWSASVTRDPLSPAAISPRIGLDANGNGFLFFAQADEAIALRYTRSSNTWSSYVVLDNQSGNILQTTLAVESSGNAVFSWVQESGGVNSVYAVTYDAATATYGPVTLLESLSTNVVSGSLRVSMSGSRASAVWLQNDGTRDNTYAATFDGTSWSGATVIESRTEAPTVPAVAVDSSGNVTALWIQSNGTAQSVFMNRFAAGAGGGGGEPYYPVPAGATWQSIANILYGVDSTAAGSALQAVLGNPPLTTGAQLTGFPSVLDVTTTITVPAYYTIPSGASWQSIANAVYGVNSSAAASALQSAMGNPPLTAGNRLTNFPATLNVVTTLAPHYLVPSGATWQSIANALFGVNSSAAGSALQTALGNPSIGSGTRLYNIPASLSVTSTVPYYYTVQSGNTWSGITQSIYGTTDANAVAALQAALGNPTLTVGARLGVPMTLNYTSASGGPAALYQRVDVLDALGQTTVYLKDTQGRLLSKTNAAGIVTSYTYHAVTGNVETLTEDPGGLNRVTTFTYDSATGLLLNTRDSLGNTVGRTYTASNQVATETVYTGRDPDGDGSGTATGGLTTRYVYDSEQHLRFVVSPDGRVTEHVYDTPGQRVRTYVYASSTYSGAYDETSLNAWATNSARRGGPLERTEYTYDFRGNLSTVERWAATNSSGDGTGAVSRTRFVYDQRGNLLQTIEARGEATSSPTNDYVTSYTYDGLGRRLTASTWVSATETVRLVESNIYDDANRTIRTTYANGLLKTLSFNRAGELTGVAHGVSGALGTTSYTYDAGGRLRVTTDPLGIKTYHFYDSAGRLQGTVDGDGSLTELVYNRASQAIKTIRYATGLSASRMTALSAGSWSTVLFSDLRTEANPAATQGRIQITRSVHDASGALVYSIDEIGAVTKFVYDGAGRLTDTYAYRNPVSIADSVNEVLPAGITISTHADDRRVRHFYNGDGLRVGTLDGAGYLTEYFYDAAGRLTKTTAYFTVVAEARRGDPTVDTMRPAASVANDITTRIFYDAQGRKIGTVDGERYFTEYTYDVAGHVLAEVRYDRELDSTGIDSTFTTFRNAALGAPTHMTVYTYDGIGQLKSATNYENTPTTYEYDSMGNVTSVTVGTGADARTTQTRYDALGRITQELSAEGYAALAAISNPTPAQIEDIWTKWGVRHEYNLAGLRVSSTTRPNDTQVNTTYYYYDNDGRLRFTLDPRRRVSELRYNALGQVVDKIEYHRTVTIGSPQGGLLTDTLIQTLAGTEAANVHEKTTYEYSRRGEVTSATTAMGAIRNLAYNAFGELESSSEGSGFTPHTYTYDQRGLQRLTRRNGVTFEDRTYDAFGRLETVVDARGNSSTTTYDRLGRELTSIQPGDANGTLITYDGFSRVLYFRDKLLNTTSYVYDDVARTVRVTTPENIEIITAHNVHGEDTSVIVRSVGAAAGTYNTVTYDYDKNGQFKSASDSLGSLESRKYDRAGRQVEETNARGVITTFEYDGANRLLYRRVDTGAGGLALVTSYAYDPQNRWVTVTEPGNRVTRTEYDRDGRVAAVVVDPNGTIPSRTEYVYDTANNVIRVFKGAGSTSVRRTDYHYDALGRRSDEYVDPNGLNLRTQYFYDDNNNVTRKIDARLYSTWYTYDAQNRLVQTIDALGGVTSLAYDAEDRVTVTRRHYNIIASTGGLGNTPGIQNVYHHPFDRVTRSVYDRDGRERFTLQTSSATGSSGNVTSETAVVTERTFDADGNVTRTRIYRNEVSVPATVTLANVQSALTDAGNSLSALHPDDRVEWTAYDLRGQVVFTVDGSGAVVRYTLGASGNVVAQIEYATSIALTNLMTTASLTTWANQSGVATHSSNRVTRTWYDSLDRARFTLDAMGYLTETRYLDSTRQDQSIVYHDKPAAPGASATLADVAAAAQSLAASPDNQTTTRTFDAAGREVQVTDAYNRSEYFAYDAVGNKVRYVNKKAASATDAAYTWIYEYDAAGRLTFERSPSVTYASIDPATLAVNETTAQVVTYNEYDALGNVIARTEAYGTSQARITRYEYDALGRQTATVSPTVGIYNVAGDSQFGNGAAVAVTETQTEVRSETSYDVFGNAFRNRLVTAAQTGDPSYTYKAYDNLGRVKYEIDAKNQVTSYKYDTFGNKEEVTRHATPLESAPWTDSTSLMSSQVSVASNPAADRTIYTKFDRLGRATSVEQAEVRNFAPSANATGGATYDGAPRTEYVYNAFGDVIRTSVQINETEFAHTYFYYNRLGQKTEQLDAGRYLTQFEYDETGDLKRQVEYARPTTGTVDYSTYGTIVPTTTANAPVGSAVSFAGYDRETTWAYDKLNRKIAENKKNLEYSSISGGTLTTSYTGTQTTTYGYDVLGNQTRVTDALGATTYNFYDVLGRLVGTAGPARDLALGTSKISFTRMARDAHGNLVRSIEYYNGLAADVFGSSPPDAPVLPTTPGTHAADRTTLMVYDRGGNVVRTRDATGADRFASYNLRGDIAKEWQVVVNPMTPVSTDDVTETIVKLYRYDALGQTTQVVESQRYNGADTDRVTRVAEYNAFGEIVYKYNLGTANEEKQYFDYDQAGRIWRTNSEDGVVKVMMYDLAGNATLELRSNGGAGISGNSTNLDVNRTLSSPGIYSSAQSVLDGFAPTKLMRTETVYDLNGNVVQRRMPSFDVDSRYPPVAGDINIAMISGRPYVNWTATPAYLGPVKFEFRVAGSGGSWLPGAVQSLAGGLAGVDVSSYTHDQTYEFRLSVTFPGEVTPAAESLGTFRVDRAIITTYDVEPTPPDPAAQISNLTIIPTAPLPANFSVLQSATYSQPAQGAQTQWWGANRVHGDWQDVGNIAVRVQVTYFKRYRDGGGQTSGTYSSWKDFAAGTARTVAEWQILPNDESQASEGGIHSIVAMRVYAINADGTTGALLRETNQGSQLNGLVWNAPADQTVTAYFRYKRTTDSTFSGDVQATRIGTYFRVNVFPLLASAGTYNYVVEYRRGSTVIAKNEGEISSSGQQTDTNITGTISSSSFSTFNEYVASPSISGLTMSWAPPSQSVTATFEYGTSTAYGNTLAITQGSTWSVNLNSITTPSSTTTYYYRTIYRQGNRIVSQQTGTFSLTPPSSSVTANATNDSPPAVVPPVSTVSGSSGVTTVTSVITRSAKYGVPSGAPPQTQWQWWDTNIVTTNFADVGNRAVRVVLQYFQKVKNSSGPSPGAVTRSMDLPANGSRTQAVFQWGIAGSQVEYEGVYSISAVRVYAINADGTTGALLRDSFASATVPAPPSISWARPADITLVATIRIGNGSAVAVPTIAGRFQYSLAGIASNTFTIDYTRPGDSGPIVSVTGSFTNDGNNVEVTSQTAINRNPTWIGVSSSGATLSWSRAAESSGQVSFRYRTSNGSWQSLTPTGGPTNYSVTFPSSVPSGNYVYEVRYVRSGEALPYVLSTGTVAVTVTNIAKSAAFGSKSDSRYPTQQVVPSLSGNTVSWSFARENAGDTVTFRYSVGGNTYSTNLSGNGPAFSAVMSQLPVGASTVSWWIEYKRAGESTFYASGSGTASMTHTQDTWPSTLTVLAQRAVYPSTITEIAAPYSLSGGYLAWDTPRNGATMAFTRNGTPMAVEAYGSGGRVNVSSLAAGEYNYEITYTTSGVVTARAVGKFTVIKETGGISNISLTNLPARVDTALSFAPTFGDVMVVDPPYAVYHEEPAIAYDENGNPYETTVIRYGAVIWDHGGGYYHVTRSTDPTNITGPFERLLREDYFYDQRLAIGIPVYEAGLVPVVEFWSVSNPGVIRTANIVNPTGSAWYADVEGAGGIANGTYGYRIQLTRQGGSAPIGTLEGTFVVGATNSITVSAGPNPAPVVATPTVRQIYDRWGNVIQVTDASNNVTDYRYNGLNLLVQTLEAQDYVFDRRDAAGTKATEGTLTRAEKNNRYDILGRLIEVQDGYNQATRVTYNAAGQQITRRNADFARHAGAGDATSGNVYDVFGNLIQTQDELGYLTRYKYDQLGRLTQVWREIDLNNFTNRTDASNLTAANPNRIQSQIYTYDQAGRRIAESNGENEVIRYRYDLLGNIILRRTNLGYTTTYQYNADGKKVGETDAIGSVATWNYNAFGQLISHAEFSNTSSWKGTNIGAVITYNYNFAGMLFTQIGGGQNVKYEYDRGGNVVSITDSGVGRKTTYKYDAAGRQVRETVVIDGRLHQDTRITYDNHNRIKTLDDPDYRERILYDVNGNRAYMSATITVSRTAVTEETYAYTYDEMNRVLKSDISLSALRENRISEFTYNGRGERATQVAPGQAWEQVGMDYRNLRQGYVGDRVAERYVYDGLGRLTDVYRNLFQTTSGTQNPTNILVSSYGYDRANRRTSEIVRTVDSQTAFVTRHTTTTYDGDGRAKTQTTARSQTGETTRTESVVSYGSGSATWNGSEWGLGFDDANNLRSYSVQFYNGNGNPTYTTTYRNNYYIADSYLESTQNATSTGSGHPEPGLTTRTYNVNHELIKFEDEEDAKRTRYFASNQAGQVLTTIQTEADNSTAYWNVSRWWDAATAHTVADSLKPGQKQYFYYVNNQQVGAHGLNSKSDWAIPHFDVNSTPISPSYPSATPMSVNAQQGDTLRTIAARAYGDPSLWYLLAEENGLSNPDEALTPGMQIRVPNDVVSLANTSDSFKPFSIAEALGDTTPTQPPPPQPKGCGVIGMIILIVVMVVVTVFTAGAATAALGAVWGTTGAAGLAAGAVGAAVGGAIGSIASQAVGVLTGIQDDFNWKQVASSALTSAFTFGIGAGLDKVGVLAGQSAAQLAGRAVINNAVGQGVNIALGIQESFDWKSVAVSAVSAPIAHKVGKAVGKGFTTEDSRGGKDVTRFERMTTKAAVNVTEGVVRKAMVGGKLDYINLAANIFGTELGNSLVQPVVDSLIPGPSERWPETPEQGNVEASGAARAAELTNNPATPQSIPTTPLDEILVTAKRMTLAEKAHYDLVNGKGLASATDINSTRFLASKGKNGRTYYWDAASGRRISNPIRREDPSLTSEVTLAETTLWDTGPYHKALLGEELGESGFLNFRAQSAGSAGAYVGADGLQLSADAIAEANLTYAERTYETLFGDVDVGVRSNAKAFLSAGLDWSIGTSNGPGGIEVPDSRRAGAFMVGGRGGAEAVAFQAHGEFTSKEVDLFFFKLQIAAEGDLNALAAGAVAGAGVRYKNGQFRMFGEFGLSALIGARGKVALNLGANEEFVQNLVDGIFDVQEGRATFIDVVSRPKVNPLANFGSWVGGKVFDLFND